MEGKRARILITGADGFFASRFIDFFRDKYEIIGYTRNQLDITNEGETLAKIKEVRPQYVVHAAAIADTRVCEENHNLSYEVNVKGSINVAKACVSIKAKLVFLSSDQVYAGNIEGGPYCEECVPVPNNVYGRHKLEAEKKIFELLPEAVVIRLTWLFGLPERNKKTNSNIIWNVVRAAIENKPMLLALNEYRGITYVYDLLKNFEYILQLKGGIYNAGSENNQCTYEIAKTVATAMGLQERMKELLLVDTERDKLQNRDLRISNEKLRRNNIYFPDTQEAIKGCIEDFRFKV